DVCSSDLVQDGVHPLPLEDASVARPEGLDLAELGAEQVVHRCHGGGLPAGRGADEVQRLGHRSFLPSVSPTTATPSSQPNTPVTTRRTAKPHGINPHTATNGEPNPSTIAATVTTHLATSNALCLVIGATPLPRCPSGRAGTARAVASSVPGTPRRPPAAPP